MNRIETLKASLELMRGLVEQCSATGTRGYYYKSCEDFCLRAGAFYLPAAESSYIKMPAKRCFQNAATLCGRHPSWRYCEGFAATASLPELPLLHAWIVLPDETVLDATWRASAGIAPFAYCGVIFPIEYVMETFDRLKEWSVIDNYREGFPLLREKFAPEKLALNYSGAPE